MRTLNDKERRALEAVQAADAEEAHRAMWWRILSRQDKGRALAVSGLDPHRAGDPLETFTPAERAQIYGMLSAHVAKMEVLIKLMGMPETRQIAPAALPKGVLPKTVH